MAKRKRRPNTTSVSEQQPVLKSRRPLWSYILAGAVIIGTATWYVQSRQSTVHRSQPISRQADSATTPKEQVSPAQVLADLEKRALSETRWGRRVSGWLEQLGTDYVVDKSLPGEMRYRVSDDKVTINPDLGMTLQEEIQDARDGFLTIFNLRFHENLHRAHENYSKWGVLWRLLRETGQMDKMFHQNDESTKTVELQFSDPQWIELNNPTEKTHGQYSQDFTGSHQPFR